MNEMDVERVVKALDCCVKEAESEDHDYCECCPYYPGNYCAVHLKKDALSMIKQLWESVKKTDGFLDRLNKLLDERLG